MSRQLSWHGLQNYDLIWQLFIKQQQHKFLQDLDYELTSALLN